MPRLVLSTREAAQALLRGLVRQGDIPPGADCRVTFDHTSLKAHAPGDIEIDNEVTVTWGADLPPTEGKVYRLSDFRREGSP